MADPTPVVFIVDDDRSVRDALRLLVESAGWQAAAFASALAFLAHPQVVVPSCLLLDVRLPDMDGCELQQRLADRPGMPIIVMSGQADVPMTTRAMKAGAMDFFTKPFAGDALLRAIGDALDRSRASLDGAARTRALRLDYASLSPRQREVMALVVAGCLNKQVGGELGISEITIKAHRGQIMRKMHAGSLPDLVRMADRLSLVSAKEDRLTGVHTR